MLTQSRPYRNGTTLALYTVVTGLIAHLWWLASQGALL
jgi:hypothetical protein